MGGDRGGDGPLLTLFTPLGPPRCLGVLQDHLSFRQLLPPPSLQFSEGLPRIPLHFHFLTKTPDQQGQRTCLSELQWYDAAPRGVLCLPAFFSGAVGRLSIATPLCLLVRSCSHRSSSEPHLPFAYSCAFSQPPPRQEPLLLSLSPWSVYIITSECWKGLDSALCPETRTGQYSISCPLTPRTQS